MFAKPEVRIIEPHRELDNPTEVVGAEADYLLAKYGFKQTLQITPTQNQDANLTFEEMIAKHEAKQKPSNNIPSIKATTFDNRNINYSEYKYTDLEIDGYNLGIRIEIVSDMKII